MQRSKIILRLTSILRDEFFLKKSFFVNVIWAAALKVTDLFIIYWLHPKFWCGSWMSLLYMHGHILCSELVNYASVKPCSSSLPQSVIIIPTASLKHVDWKQNIKLPPDWPGESPLTNLTASSGCECNIDSKWILHARTVPASFLFQISADIRSVLFSLASGRLKLHVWLHACCVRTFVSCILAQPHFFLKKKTTLHLSSWQRLRWCWCPLWSWVSDFF